MATQNDIVEIAERFRGRRILVVGDVMLDEYIWGSVERISPEAPVPVVQVQRRSHVPGGAANTAANVASLGGLPILGGVVGHDLYAELLREKLGESSVEASGLVADAQRPTTCKTRIVAHDQQIVRVDCEQRNTLPADVEESLLAWAREQIKDVDACILSDYAKGVVSPRLAQGLIQAARAAGKPLIVDPKPDGFAKYRGATLVKPNLLEAERVCNRRLDGDEQLRAAGSALCELLEGSAVLITLGSRGMMLFRPGVAPVGAAATQQQVFDVTGAGDTVASALAMGLAAGISLDEAARLGNRCAGIAVGKVGTNTVTLDELLADHC
ncbi:MAG TPA: D-glycero-beta-D-manno-heptose-7-phosphate kinase [Pirellulales bacterium]|nr:D-glycero-beta-D-manno-heptose-7-phosphate kinase [Pirellulales bacterium]